MNVSTPDAIAFPGRVSSRSPRTRSSDDTAAISLCAYKQHETDNIVIRLKNLPSHAFVGVSENRLDITDNSGMEIADDKIADESVCSDSQAENPSRRTQAFQQLLERSPNVELTDAMATICGINEAEFRVYLVILDHPHCSIAEIADILDRDSSTIGKQLKSLLGQEFVTRYPRNVADGGVKYLHVAQSLAKTKQQLQEEAYTWMDTVQSQLMKLRSNEHPSIDRKI